MTALGICFEWLVVFIEFTLGHYFMNIFFEKQFSEKSSGSSFLLSYRLRQQELFC